MIQRFFFNGIDLQRSGRTIAKAIKFATAVHADKTEATLPFANVAMPRTQVAMDAAVRLALPPLRFMKAGGFGNNRERSHTHSHGSPSHRNFLIDYNASSSASVLARGGVPRPNPQNSAFDGDTSTVF